MAETLAQEGEAWLVRFFFFFFFKKECALFI